MSDDFDNDDLSWLRDDDPGEEPPEDDETFDWQQADTPGQQSDADRLGFTGELSWMRGEGDDPDVREPDRLGMTGELPWMQGADADDPGAGAADEAFRWLDEQGESGADEPAESAWLEDARPDSADRDLPDWLRASEPAAEDQPPSGDPSPPPDDSAGEFAPPPDDVPAWLRDSDELTTPEASQEEVPDWLLGLDEEQADQQPYTVGGELSADWLAQGDALPETSESDLTYDEWQAQQEAASRIPELDEFLPEEFAELDDEGPVSPEEMDTGALPDWFLGMEELDTSEAPDWFTEGEADPTAPNAPTEPVSDDIYNDPAPTLSLDDFFSTVEIDQLPEAELLDDEDEASQQAAPAATPPAPTDAFGDDFFASIGVDDTPQDDEPAFEFEEDAAQPEEDFGDDFFSSFSPESSQTDDLPEPALADFGEDFLSTLGMEDEAAPAEPEAEPEPDVEPLPGNFFESLGLETQAETPADDFDLDSLFAAEAETSEPVEFDPALPDGEFLGALGIEEDADAEPAFDWFADAEQGIAEDVESADWLGELGDLEDLPQSAEAEMPDEDFFADLTPAEPVHATEAELDDLDSLLASLDDVDIESDLPDSGLLTASEDVNFDTLFSDPAFADIDQPAEPDFDRADLLTELGATVGTASAAAYLRQQRDRPLEELPDRLKRLRDEADQIGTAAQPESRALTDVLPGVTDGLAAGVLEMDSSRMASGLTITPDQQKRVELLRALTASEESTPRPLPSAIDLTYDTGFMDDEAFSDLRDDEAAPQAEAAPVPLVRRRRRVKLDRLLITLVLGAAIIAPFFLRQLRIGSPPPASFAADSRQQAAFNTLGALQPGDLVLVGAEYGPTAAGELDSLTQVILQHILTQQALPVVVSGNPVGLLRTGNLLERLGDDQTFLARLGRGTPLAANNDYYVVRYLPGAGVGLRALGTAQLGSLLSTDAAGQQTGLDSINSLDRFAAVVVIAERPEDLRNWAEQIAPLTNRPLVAATTFAASPLAEPYLGAALDGLLVGYADALTYDALLLGGAEALPPGEVEPLPPAGEATEEADAAITPTATTTPTPPPPTATATPAVSGIITATSTINLREGPGATFAVVGSLSPGDEVVVLGEDETGAWVNVRLPQGAVEGWVSSNLIVVRRPAGTTDEPQASATPDTAATATTAPTSTARPTDRPTTAASATPRVTDTPAPTATPTQSPTPIPTVITARVTATETINVRSGPATTFAPVGTAGPGDEFTVIGRNGAGDWIQVDFPGAEEAWIAAFLLDISAEQVPETSAAGGLRLVRAGRAGIPFAPYRALAQATDEATPEAADTAVTTIPAQVDAARSLPYAEERWYSMTLGLVVIIVVIVMGALVNVIRALRRRN